MDRLVVRWWRSWTGWSRGSFLDVAQTFLQIGQSFVAMFVVGSTIADQGLQLVEGLLGLVQISGRGLPSFRPCPQISK